jgi:hypothetical protein
MHATRQLSEWQEMLWRLTRHELSSAATWNDSEHIFHLHELPDGVMQSEVPLGRYRLGAHLTGDDCHSYRYGHPLAQQLIDNSLGRRLPVRVIDFSYSDYGKRISVLENMVGSAGWLAVSRLCISGHSPEDHLIYACIDDNGVPIESDDARRLFQLPGVAGDVVSVPGECETFLVGRTNSLCSQVLAARREASVGWIGLETEKLHQWAEDLKLGLERELRVVAAELRSAHEQSRLADTMEKKLHAQVSIREIERRQRDKRKKVFEAHDEIDAERERLIVEASQYLDQTDTCNLLCTIRWRVH